jgi:hypothetical protein
MQSARIILAAAGAVTVLTIAVAGCIDLFHSTALTTRCELDASAEGCGPVDDAGSVIVDAVVADAPREATRDAGNTGPTDFCTWMPREARAHAEHACAWLGACAGSSGDNAFGTCMLDAVRAYDCATNPDRKVLGGLHEYWDCLWQATDCDAVHLCVNPARVEADAAACTGVACDVTKLRDCSGGMGVLGVDCAFLGGSDCVTTNAGPACVAAGDACAATAEVTCAAGVARGCPSGRGETVDCNALLGLPTGAPSACIATSTGAAWDVSRACQVADVGGCRESCDVTNLNACARGVPVSVDCSALGLDTCVIPDDAGSSPRCVPKSKP